MPIVQIGYFAIILACFTYTAQWSGGLWLNSDANSTTFQSIKFTNTADPANQTYFFTGILGETSGDIYTHGWYNNGTWYSFITRIAHDFSFVWYKLYTPQGSVNAFDISPTEDFFYFLKFSTDTNADLRLYKGDAENGAIVLTFDITSFQGESQANIEIIPSNDALYINTDSFASDSSSQGLIIMR